MNDYIIELLKKLINIDTRSDINNEIEAAILLKEYFDDMAVESDIYEPIPGKGSICAKITGKSKDTIILHSHLDTDDYGDISKWNNPPQKSFINDGKIYGRGALDCKSQTAVHMAIFKSVYESAKRGSFPDKSLMMIVSADEENASKYGTVNLAENTECLNDCILVIGEGGGYPLKAGKSIYYTLQIGERDKIKLKSKFMSRNTLLNLFLSLINGAYDINTIMYLLKTHNKNIRKMPNNILLENEYINNEKGKFAYRLPFSMLNRENSNIDVYGGYSKGLKNIKRMLRNILNEENKNYKLMPVITPGTSDNRIFREKGIKTIGFFPIIYNNSLSGIHGYNEYISLVSLDLSYKVLYKFVYKIIGMELE